MVSGVKSVNGTLGVTQNVKYKDCSTVKGNEVTTIFEQAEKAGLSTAYRFHRAHHPRHTGVNLREDREPRHRERFADQERCRQGLQGHCRAADRLAGGQRLRGDPRRRPLELHAGQPGRSGSRRQDGRAQGRRDLSRNGRPSTMTPATSGTRRSSTPSTRPRPAISSACSSAATCSTRPTARRTRAASRRWPR